MMKVYRDLCEAVPEWEVVFFVRDQEVDLLLVLNACRVQCALVPEFKGPVVIVSPDTVDYWTIGEQQYYLPFKVRHLEISK